jgi:hypothetical protein
VYLTDPEMYILRSLTQFEARIYEQSLITKFKPSLNNTNIVTFPFTNWVEGETGLNDPKDVYVMAKSKDNSLTMNFSSLNAAVTSLGIAKTTLRRYLNYKNCYLKSPILEKEFIIFNTKYPLLKGKPDTETPTNYEPITDIDLYKLEPGKLYAYLMDKNTLFSTFKSPNEAAALLDGKKDSKYISRYINLDRPVIVGPDRIAVYFLMHPDWKKNKSGRIAHR